MQASQIGHDHVVVHERKNIPGQSTGGVCFTGIIVNSNAENFGANGFPHCFKQQSVILERRRFWKFPVDIHTVEIILSQDFSDLTSELPSALLARGNGFEMLVSNFVPTTATNCKRNHDLTSVCLLCSRPTNDFLDLGKLRL